MFSVLDALLFRPPVGVRDPAALQRLAFRTPNGALRSATPYAAFARMADRLDSAERVAAFAGGTTSTGYGSDARRIRIAFVSPGFFELLGVPLAFGRGFSDSEADPRKGAPVAIVSWEYWRSSLGARPAVGESLHVGREVYTVIGVAPRGFGGVDLTVPDVWFPMSAVAALVTHDPNWYGRRWSLPVTVLARPSVDKRVFAQRATTALREENPGAPATSVRVELTPTQSGYQNRGRSLVRTAALLVTAALALLLVACLNTASLLVARTLSREGEFAIRLALGSSVSGIARLLWLDAAGVVSRVIRIKSRSS